MARRTQTLPEHVAALLRPEAYPYAVGRIELVQTHISYVFLTDERVFKLKKAVDLGFLDFSTLEKRRHFCEEEVRLNQRGCGSVYLRVLPLTRHGNGYRLGGEGEVVDYAVEMRRLPAEGMMDRLLEAGKVTYDMIGAVVARLVEFHRSAETSERITRLGGSETFAANWQDNLREIEPHVGRTLSRPTYERLHRFGERQLAAEVPLMRRREREGRIRDCHGDLRSDSVVFDPQVPGGICLFDTIEFNERLRFSDTALDVAFLAMDLDFRGHADLSDLLAGLYAPVAADETLPLLLNLFKCYRACIRGKVESLLAAQAEVGAPQRAKARARARAYFRLADAYARGRPFGDIVLVMGLSGSGKSVLAGRLAARLGAVLLSTDAVRRQTGQDTRQQQALDAGRYAPEARQAVYEQLRERAARYAAEGRGVVLDGTFIERRQRRLVEAPAPEQGRRLLLVECYAPESVVEERQRRRAGEAWATSEGRWDIYLAQKQRFEPPDELPESQRLRIDTTTALDAQVEAVLQRLGRSPVSG